MSRIKTTTTTTNSSQQLTKIELINPRLELARCDTELSTAPMLTDFPTTRRDRPLCLPDEKSEYVLS